MRYVKRLPDKRIEIDGIEYFHCTLGDHYVTRNEIIGNKNHTYGVCRSCKKCHNETYHVRLSDRQPHRTSDQIAEDDKHYRRNKHINLWGVTDEDVAEVAEVMKRLGFTTHEPVWIQWHRKHGFRIKHTS